MGEIMKKKPQNVRTIFKKQFLNFQKITIREDYISILKKKFEIRFYKFEVATTKVS